MKNRTPRLATPPQLEPAPAGLLAVQCLHITGAAPIVRLRHDVGSAISSWRIGARLSRADIATRISVSVRRVSKWEHGGALPRRANLEAMMDLGLRLPSGLVFAVVAEEVRLGAVPASPTPAQVAAIESAYQLARADADRTARYGSGATLARTCRYCGSFRFAGPGSTLDGHARCVVTAELKTFLVGVLRTMPALTLSALAELLGVTTGTIRRWCCAVRSAG